ncbi:MAG: hypothetical protein AB1461_10345 [Thermodesulfobacteriota bacterium]
MQLAGTDYDEDYWAAVALIHFMREKDSRLPVAELVRGYPYSRARQIVMEGWE